MESEMSYKRLLIFVLIAIYSIPGAALGGGLGVRLIYELFKGEIRPANWAFPMFFLIGTVAWGILILMAIYWIFDRKLPPVWPKVGTVTAIVGILLWTLGTLGAGLVPIAFMAGPAIIFAFHLRAWHLGLEMEGYKEHTLAKRTRRFYEK